MKFIYFTRNGVRVVTDPEKRPPIHYHKRHSDLLPLWPTYRILTTVY